MNVNGDLEVYLPDGSQVSVLIEEVEEDWTTNVMIIYVESEAVNVTTIPILKQIDAMESAMNSNRNDGGEFDDIIYVLSISAVIKEVNSSAVRVAKAFASGVAASTGQDIQIVDVAVSYADNDNCVVASGLEIDASNASELAGKKVSVPIGTAAHYGFLKQMEHFGVSVDSMQVVDMAPPEGAAALAQGSIDMFCGWGGSLRRALEHGNVLLTGAEKTALGILVWDVTSVPASFADENAEVLQTFLGVTAAANAMWNSGGFTDMMIPHIAKDAGMDEQATRETMATFVFPSVSNQLGDNWLGGSGAAFLKGVADVFVNSGNIPSARGSYANAINTDGLEGLAAQ